jgi:hypothetical protein
VEAVRRLLSEEVERAERRLVSAGLSKLVPLTEAIGRRKWIDLVKGIERWSLVARRGVGKRTKLAKHHDPVLGTGDTFGLGSEPWWVCRRLRLRGRPDEAYLADDGGLDIVDYKTGSIEGRGGVILDRVAIQLRLYIVMAEELSPRRPIRAYVEHPEPYAMEWGEGIRVETVQRLHSMSGQFPSGVEVEAGAAAKAGLHCRGCGLRPGCQTYLHTVPVWWSNAEGHPRPLPFDVWGSLQSVERTAAGWLVQLLDAGGRRVQIEGLETSWRLDQVSPGVVLYFFNLEATEDTEIHGNRIYPRNFHEIAPGLPWRSALQVRIFRSR